MRCSAAGLDITCASMRHALSRTSIRTRLGGEDSIMGRCLLGAGTCARPARLWYRPAGEYAVERCARELAAMGLMDMRWRRQLATPEDIMLKGVEDGARPARSRATPGLGDLYRWASRWRVDMFDCDPTRVASRHGLHPQRASGQGRRTSGPAAGGRVRVLLLPEFGPTRHLLNVGEILGVRLLTIHNMHRYLSSCANCARRLPTTPLTVALAALCARRRQTSGSAKPFWHGRPP